MFGIGSTELLVILMVALIALGPKSLARVSRSLGKMVGEFRRVSTDFQRALNVEAAEEEARAARDAYARKQAAGNVAAPAGSDRAGAGQQERHEPQIAEANHAANAASRAKAADSPAGPPPDSPLGKAITQAAQAARQEPTQDNKA